jgi:hypothetical protein
VAIAKVMTAMQAAGHRGDSTSLTENSGELLREEIEIGLGNHGCAATVACSDAVMMRCR